MVPARNRRRLNWPVPIARRGRGSAEVDLKATFSYKTSIDKNSEKSSQLSRVLIWLNVILIIATLALAIIAGTDLYLRIQGVDSFHQSTQISTDVSK